MGDFWRYYSGAATAPVLTIVIGGNHEASNHMWELYYGGWLAPNIYFLGSAGFVNVGGLRIGGISGIYKKFDYHKGHHEVPPLSSDDIVSIFHTRSLEVMRCKSIRQPVDIFMSHDWPIGVYDFGDRPSLIRAKPFFEDEIKNNDLGSPSNSEILEIIQPAYWFSGNGVVNAMFDRFLYLLCFFFLFLSLILNMYLLQLNYTKCFQCILTTPGLGHLHVKFSAIIPHDDFGKATRFLALDKCLPRRKFLQILDIGQELHGAPPVLEYDPEWLAVLADTAKYYSPLNFDQRLPAWLEVTEERIEEVVTAFGPLQIPENFTVTACFYCYLGIEIGMRIYQEQAESGNTGPSLAVNQSRDISNEWLFTCFGIPNETIPENCTVVIPEEKDKLEIKLEEEEAEEMEKGGIDIPREEFLNPNQDFKAPEYRERGPSDTRIAPNGASVVRRRLMDSLPLPVNTGPKPLKPLLPRRNLMAPLVKEEVKTERNLSSEERNLGEDQIKTERNLSGESTEKMDTKEDPPEEEEYDPSAPDISLSSLSAISHDTMNVALGFVDEEFDVDNETDDALVAKFMSLKKRRDLLSHVTGYQPIRDQRDRKRTRYRNRPNQEIPALIG
eukprot:sb/3463112/